MTNQSSVFKDGIPGKKWLKLFLNRWKKELSERTPQNVPQRRGAAVTRECVDDFYGMVEKSSNHSKLFMVYFLLLVFSIVMKLESVVVKEKKKLFADEALKTHVRLYLT
jgi:hypothetical protein